MTDIASTDSPASVMERVALQGPTALIHIGRPDAEEPHRSMKRVMKLRAEKPKMPFFLLVWTKEDELEMKKYEDEKVKVLLWESDEQLSSFLLDFLTDLVGAFIIGPRHYICPDKHVTEGGYAGLIEKCPTCGMGVVCILQFEERVKEFAALFEKVIHLANFDTRSGEWLQTQVNPSGNIVRNSPYIVGCEHQEALNVKDREKGKTAIIVGAGPSLENAVSDLVRLSRREDVFVVCVGRVFKMLRKAGVRVAYTASCEMFDWDSAIFDGIGVEDAGDTVLAFASMCAPATVRAWPGKKVAMLDIQTAQMLVRDDWIFGGNSVAHHMLNFAMQILGAKDAILVGIDLAYPKMKTHAEGSNHDKWPENIRQAEDAFQDEMWVPCTGKGEEFDPNCHRVPVVMGGGVAISNQILVRSSPAYECFATLFSILVAKHGKKVWNACPNGQKIGGTEYLDLSKYMIE